MRLTGPEDIFAKIPPEWIENAGVVVRWALVSFIVGFLAFFFFGTIYCLTWGRRLERLENERNLQEYDDIDQE